MSINKDLKEIRESYIEEDYLLWRMKRTKDKGYSSLSEDYLKGYEDCLRKIGNKITKLIEKDMSKGGKK